MFRKLRNKLILINLSITSVVIVVVFTMIYVISTKSAEGRPPEIQGMNNASDEEWQAEAQNESSWQNSTEANSEKWQKMVLFSLRQEKKVAAEQLLITLICSGVAIEIMVVIISSLMAEEAIKPVKEAYDAQKVFIANASHEIKTPLAAIAANLEAADITGNKWISNVERETEKLAALNNELLTLARTDLVTDVKAEEVDLFSVTGRVLDGFEPRLKGKRLLRDLKVERKVKINAADFEQILSILMDNAVKYSDKKIQVYLTEHTLTIENDGAKIAPEKLPYIFDRFYQADKTTEGVGLGLAIAKSVAERNHWKLGAESAKNTVFILEF